MNKNTYTLTNIENLYLRSLVYQDIIKSVLKIKKSKEDYPDASINMTALQLYSKTENMTIENAKKEIYKIADNIISRERT